MNTIKIKYVGEDSFGRKVYKNIENKRIYKNVNCITEPMKLCISDSFDGEPDFELRDDLEIIIVEKDKNILYHMNICLNKDKVNELERLLEIEQIDFSIEDIESDSTLLNETVKFSDGYMVDFKVCCGQTNCWCEAVLFDENGNEVQTSEPDFSVLGQYHFSFKDTEYLVEIKLED